MVTFSDQLDLTFGALADPTRRAIVDLLAEREHTVSEIARPFPVSRPAISKHLRVLQSAGIITRTKRGRENVCRLDGERLQEALKWVAQYRKFWERQLGQLERYLEEEETSE